MDGEQPFIDGEFIAVREDHGVIIGQLSMEGVVEDFVVKERECQMETIPRM